MCRIQWSPTKKKRELEKSALSFQTDRSNIYEIKKWQEKEYNQRKSVEIHEKNNQWKKSVWIREICGTKIINEKKSASSAKSAWQTNIQREEKTAEKKKIREKKKQESLRNLSKSEALHWKEAATYSPALHCSTIGASGLNFSVRNGKRWNPTAITTW